MVGKIRKLIALISAFVIAINICFLNVNTRVIAGELDEDAKESTKVLNKNGTDIEESENDDNEDNDDEIDEEINEAGDDNEAPTEIAEDDISIVDYMLAYNGSEQWPDVLYKDILLTKDTDYTICCPGEEHPVNAGTYDVEITMTGGYTCEDTIHRSFSIEKASVIAEGLLMPAIEVSSDYIKLTDTQESYEYQLVAVDINDVESSMPYSDNWRRVSETGEAILYENLLPGKPYYIYFRLKETDNYKASNMFRYMISTSLVVELKGDSADDFDSRSAGHTLTAEVTGEVVNAEEPGPYLYFWYRDDKLVDKTTKNTYLLGKSDIGHIITLEVMREAPFETQGFSQEILAVAPQITSEQIPTVINVDYKNEKISLLENGYFELSLTDKAEEGVAELTDLSPVIDEKTFDVYVRNIVDEREYWHTYLWTKYTIQGRPDAPNVTIQNASGKSKMDGLIKSETTGLEFKLKTGTKYVELTSDTKVAPGTYLVRVAATDKSFAGLDTEVTISYAGSNVAKASKRPSTKGRITYNGQEQQLVNAGESSEGKIEYSTSKDGSYSSSIPTAKKAGTYITWWRVKADDKHTDSSPLSIVTTITKKQLTIGTTITAEKKYDGTTKVDIDWSKVGLNGVLNKDEVGITGTAVFENPDIGINKKIKITGLKLTGAAKDNYMLASSSASGTGIITTQDGKIVEKSNTTNSTNTSKKNTNYRKITSSRTNYDYDMNEAEMVPVQDEYEQYLSSIGAKPNLSTGKILVGDNGEEGKILSKYISVEDISIKDRDLIDDTIGDISVWMPNIEILKYMDISVFAENEMIGWSSVEETSEPVELVIGLSSEERKADCIYFLLRIHNGEAELLSDEDDDNGTVTVSSNLFSTYVLLAKGPEVPLAGQAKDELNESDRAAVICGLIVVGISLAWIFNKRRSFVNVLIRNKRNNR